MDPILRRDEAALTELEVDWRALWERDPTASLFHTNEYARTAWETELGADRQLAIVELREHAALVGLAAFTVDPDGTLRFLGNEEITDYLGPLSAGRLRDRIAGAIVNVVQGLEWTRADLAGLAADSGWPDALVSAAASSGMEASLTDQDVCPRIQLTGTYDDYLASLPGKLRHEIRRKERRLAREAGDYTIRLSDASVLDQDLERFYEMHRAQEGPKGKFMHDEMATVFTRLAHTFADRGWLRLAWLEVGGESLAATLSFSERGVWSVYNSAFDHRTRELGPGMVLMGETIRLAADEGCAVFDLLRGDEPYKYRFGATDVPLVRLTLAR